MYSLKNLFRILIDLAIIALSWFLASYIRLEGDLSSPVHAYIWFKQLPIHIFLVLIIKFICLFFSGTYKKFWRYTSIQEITSLASILLIPSLVFLIPRLTGISPTEKNLWAVSFGIVIIDYLLSLSLLSSVRLFRFYLVEQKNIKKRLLLANSNNTRTLIIGAGEAGLQVIKSINAHPELALKILGVLDDDTKKHGMELSPSIQVKGFISDVKYWVDELSINQIIIAIPSLSQKKKREISKLASSACPNVRIVPGVDQLAGGQVSIEKIRKLSMEDLLGREEIDLAIPEVLGYLENKKVLVTGAGGSIGRELCKQLVLKCKIQKLALLGKGENSIFETWQELLHLRPDFDSRIEKIIADIKNYDRIEKTLLKFQADVIFHAAAHKHVHLMELNPCEAFENNVLGTKNLAELAGKYKVPNFVLISTDKSVNPTSIMGATKNLAEKVMLLASKDFPKTKYTAVRFGNVLGSRGSVIRVWQKQLEDGHPITVTHKEALRYFMTIPEAAQLVIQAASKAASGEIMVLDMGEPVKIYELAQSFIKLSGFSSDDVQIKFIGLKEGEKLYEELLTDSEQIDSQLTEKIFKARIDFNLNTEDFSTKLKKLSELSRSNESKACSEFIRTCF
jgi:FlaA1/EpsC-like NDP-sugar epimerase